MVYINAPEADMLAVSKSNIINRRSILGFAPKIGLNVVDYSKLDYSDRFYLDCQNYRDYYRDTYRKLHIPTSFLKHYSECGGEPDPNIILEQPTRWISEEQPVVAPVNYGRQLTLGQNIQLAGQCDGFSCIRFKR